MKYLPYIDKINYADVNNPLDHFMAEATKFYQLNTICNRNIDRDTQHTYIQQSVVQYSVVQPWRRVLLSCCKSEVFIGGRGFLSHSMKCISAQLCIVECSTVQCSQAVEESLIFMFAIRGFDDISVQSVRSLENCSYTLTS